MWAPTRFATKPIRWVYAHEKSADAGAAPTPMGCIMLRTSGRRVIAAIGTATIAAAATLAFGVAPAQAAPSGHLLTKGSGSLYTTHPFVHLGIVPGSAAKSYYYKIVNTSSTAESFKVNLLADPSMTAKLYQGFTAVPNDYTTKAIAPGQTLSLKLKITVAEGTPQGTYYATILLRDPSTNGIIDAAYATAEATYQTGTARDDLFLKTGTQPYVGGGSAVEQSETASVIKPGGTSTFKLRIKNNSTSAAAIPLIGSNGDGDCPAQYSSFTVKQGTKDVTTAVDNGSYSTGQLAPGASKNLTVAIKASADTPCEVTHSTFASLDPGSSSVVHPTILISQ